MHSAYLQTAVVCYDAVVAWCTRHISNFLNAINPQLNADTFCNNTAILQQLLTDLYWVHQWQHSHHSWTYTAICYYTYYIARYYTQLHGTVCHTQMCQL